MMNLLYADCEDYLTQVDCESSDHHCQWHADEGLCEDEAHDHEHCDELSQAECGTDACMSDDSEIDMCVENSNANNEMKIHPHFLCNDCGISLCLPVKIIVPEIPNYKVESAEQLLTGKCENCS